MDPEFDDEAIMLFAAGLILALATLGLAAGVFFRAFF